MLSLLKVLQENEMLRQFLRQSGATSITAKLTEAKQRKSEVQAKIVAEFMRQDPVFGNYLLSCWEAFLKKTEDGRNLDFGTLDNYLSFRLDDVGAVYVYPNRTNVIITVLTYSKLDVSNPTLGDRNQTHRRGGAYCRSNRLCCLCCLGFNQ